MRLKCPKCGSKSIEMILTCHTWPRKNEEGKVTWMSCLPCDSAYLYWCVKDECDWEYTEGLNPKNPRAAENELNKPDWIDQEERFDLYYEI